MVKCQICGREFKQITNTHLKCHNITVEQYKKDYPNKAIVSEDISKLLSEQCKQQHLNDNDFGFKNGHQINVGNIPWNKGETKETSEKVLQYSEKLIGREFSDDTKIKISESKKQFFIDHPECKPIGIKNGMFGKKLSPEHLKALWSSRFVKNKGMNKVEAKAFMTLISFGFKYTGNNSYMITFKDGHHKFPDFINEDMKTVVEIYGDYWHKDDDPNEIIEKYAQIGWKCLVYWEHEVNNNNLNPDKFEQDINIWEKEEFKYEDFFNDWMSECI